MERERDLDGAVLIVEDNYSLRTTLATVLEEENYPVVTASNGASAVRLLLQGATRPALMVLDLMLPIMSGWEVLTHIQRDPSLADIPVVVLSAIAEDPERRPTVPVAAIVSKPVDLDTLLSVVARFYRSQSGGRIETSATATS
jgi:CheY-like chemotaxis protein